MEVAFASMFAADRRTSFGEPVLPEVDKSTLRSGCTLGPDPVSRYRNAGAAIASPAPDEPSITIGIEKRAKSRSRASGLRPASTRKTGRRDRRHAQYAITV